MSWELLEAVIRCMIVFQALNFVPVIEILKIGCHIYILMKIVIILMKNTCENEVFCSTIERN